MQRRFRTLVFAAGVCVSLAQLSLGAVIFKSGPKQKALAPAEEEVNGTAQQLFQAGEAAEQRGDLKRAATYFRKIVKRYPKDTLAAGSAYRTAQLEEQMHDYLRAAGDYRYVVERFSQSAHFNEAIEAQFRIGEMYLNGKKQRLLGIPVPTSLDHAVEIFAAIVRTAPYGRYTARAQFDIGLVREKQGLNDAAVAAYQAVVDKFPSDPVAADAQYQIGYIWYAAAKAGTQDSNAARLAKTGFEDFLFRYPHSEKVAQARENLGRLEHKTTNDSFQIAKFYDKQKRFRAAAIYYNDTIRQQAGSNEAEQAKRRLEELRKTLGDAAMKEAASVAVQPKKTAPRQAANANTSSNPGGAGASGPAMRGSANDIAPLPPQDADFSLPPPASLMPDSTTAPSTSPSAPPAASPEPSSTPEATASPTE